jgi:hypothetical protein
VIDHFAAQLELHTAQLELHTAQLEHGNHLTYDNYRDVDASAMRSAAIKPCGIGHSITLLHLTY